MSASRVPGMYFLFFFLIFSPGTFFIYVFFYMYRTRHDNDWPSPRLHHAGTNMYKVRGIGEGDDMGARKGTGARDMSCLEPHVRVFLIFSYFY